MTDNTSDHSRPVPGRIRRERESQWRPCSITQCRGKLIEHARFAKGAHGGSGLSISIHSAIGLCRAHQAERRRLGHYAFEKRYGLNLPGSAGAFVRRSPPRAKSIEGCAASQRRDSEVGQTRHVTMSADALYPTSPQLTDLEAYRLLTGVAERLSKQAPGCWSTVAASALEVGAKALLTLAAALHLKNIATPTNPPDHQ